MKELEERIRKEGRVYPGEILKVDSFLNHQVDMELMDHIGAEFCRLFADKKITKVLTIEASGIVPAAAAAFHFGVPLVYAKKKGAANADNSCYETTVHSYTYNKDYYVTVDRKYLSPEDHVLIVDDFLANGKAAQGLLDIVRQAGAVPEGFGICIEKTFQNGGKELRGMGYRVESLARIAEMTDTSVTLAE